MSKHGKQILEEALALSAEERVQLIEELVSSLDSQDRQRIDELWATEVEERLDAYEQGKIEAIPAKQVFDEGRGKKA